MLKLELCRRLLDFRRVRDWEQFRTPKELAIALLLECSELLEVFQWKKDDEVSQLRMNGASRDRVLEEVADIAAYLFYLCHDLGLDMNEAVDLKLRKNEIRYPADKVRGCAKKYDQY